MSSLFLTVMGAASQGILWGVMALGVYITYRLLNIADLTVDGSFALGACVCAVMIVNFKVDPLLALVFSTLAGAAAGAVTGVIHTFFEIPSILAGILTQISLWSINLKIMSKSNIPLPKDNTIFSKFVKLTGLSNLAAALLIGLIISILVIVFLYWFFGTEIGSALRAAGNNEAMIRALGVDTKLAKLLALMLSNALVGLAGGLVSQQQKYADINIGTGAIVIGLAAIVIGEVLMGKFISFYFKLISAVIGSAIYFIIRAFVISMGMNANDMKLISAIIVLIALASPVVLEKWRLKRAYSPMGREEDGNA